MLSNEKLLDKVTKTINTEDNKGLKHSILEVFIWDLNTIL